MTVWRSAAITCGRRPPRPGDRSASKVRRCSKGVDPVLDYHPKLVAIDEEADHQIVHGRGFGKTNCTPHEPFNPCPQIDVFTLDFLRILFANCVLLGIDMALVGPPPIR